jgi:[acyl-carrier-protein] S-malonyltransferase
VRWIESVETMAARGVTRFIEIGPKDVLTGLVRRIDENVSALTCGTAAGVQTLTAS